MQDSVNNGVNNVTIDNNDILKNLKEQTIKYYRLEDYKDKIAAEEFNGYEYINFVCYVTNGVEDVLSKYIIRPISCITFDKGNNKLGTIKYYYNK